MSDEKADPQTVTFELHIKFRPSDGNVEVNGPIGNKELCWDMLFSAFKIVARHIPLQVASGGNGKDRFKVI